MWQAKAWQVPCSLCCLLELPLLVSGARAGAVLRLEMMAEQQLGLAPELVTGFALAPAVELKLASEVESALGQVEELELAAEEVEAVAESEAAHGLPAAVASLQILVVALNSDLFLFHSNFSCSSFEYTVLPSSDVLHPKVFSAAF